MACPRCGALNGADFDRCIRCGAPISALATSTERLKGRIDPRSLPATKFFAALTILIFAAQSYADLKRTGSLSFLTGIDQRDFLRFGGLPIHPDIVTLEPWRLLSAVFVHIGVLHFVFNMFGLVDLGRLAEPIVGSARLAIAYVVTGIVGFGTTIAMSLVTQQGSGTAGASGALFGIMGVILGFLIRRRDPRWKDFMLRAVLFSLLFGFGLNAMGSGIRINNTAHVGGLLCGVLLGVLFGGPQRRSDLWANAASVVCALGCIVSVVLAQLSPLARQDRWWMFSEEPPALIVPGRPTV
jgi:rhomboid protease GluP